MAGETADLRTALLEAFQATDSETAWFLDRRKLRVVTVRRGVVSDPLLRARDVEDDELRFVEIPALAEADVHVWMEEFVEDCDDPRAAPCLDQRFGANARFEEKLGAVDPALLRRWRQHRLARVGADVDAWAARVLAEPTADGAGLTPDG